MGRVSRPKGGVGETGVFVADAALSGLAGAFLEAVFFVGLALFVDFAILNLSAKPAMGHERPQPTLS
jgi:hypothetical protein